MLPEVNYLAVRCTLTGEDKKRFKLLKSKLDKDTAKTNRFIIQRFLYGPEFENIVNDPHRT